MVWVLLFYALEIPKWLIIIRALMSWFVSPGTHNPFVEFIRRATDPILRPLAGMVPAFGGVDVTPLLAFFAIYLFQQLILRLA